MDNRDNPSQQKKSRPQNSAPPESSGVIIRHIPLEFNFTRTKHPPSRCLHEWLAGQAARTPNAVAVTFENQSLTYRELDERANQLAHFLCELGLGPDRLAGLCVERDLPMIIGLLAILKAGGAYVPLDPAYPAERLGLMLEDARPLVILTQKKLAPQLPGTPARVICLDDPAVVNWETRPVTPPENRSQPDDLAYVIFTSGSTGRPKGALITHYNVVRLLEATEPWFHFNEKDVWTLFHSYAFDFSVWEIWGALLYGGRLVVVPYFTSRSPRAFYELLQAEQVTVLNQTPSAFLQLMQAEAGMPAPGPLALRQVIFGGEALALPSLQPWFERHGDQQPQLVNMYGITETTVHVTYRPIRKADVTLPSVIGEPIPDLEIYLLDAQGRRVAEGETGEIYVGGAGVGRGYLNRPELTAERFIPNPFKSVAGERLYRSGDLARRRPDGELEYLGRADQQIKIRGHRIELGEIEAALAGNQLINAGAVVAQKQNGEQVLVAYVVGREGQVPRAGTLRQWLAQRIPDYMIPARFVQISALPLNNNGKVDRAALAQLDGVELAMGAEYVSPNNDLERTLAEIWQMVLRRERVGMLDNFFDLGGHSLLAVGICAQISRRLQCEVPLRWVFELPTIRLLAGQLTTRAGTAVAGEGISLADRSLPLPMSFGQQQMWLLQQSVADPATYNQPMVCRLTGQMDAEKLRRALRRIQDRHEVLRTALRQSGADLVQVVVPADRMTLPWQEQDLTGVPEDQQEAVWQARLLAESRQPFNLAQAPLWRALWLELGETKHILAFIFHHSIIDEWSLRLLVRELELSYPADGQMETAALPPLPVQYADLAVWQHQQLSASRLEKLRQYWQEQLRDLPPPMELPADRPKPLRPTGGGAVYNFQINGAVVQGFRQLARQENATLFTMMLAACQVWLHRYTGQTDLLVGIPVALRDRPEVQPLLGYFLNTLPVRTRLTGSQCFRALAGQVRDTLLSGFSHADLPIDKIAELAGQPIGAGQSGLFQVMFVLLEEGLPPLCLDQAVGQWTPAGTQTSKNDLLVSIQAGETVWDCQLEYATDRFTAERAARLAGHLTELLQSIVAAPQTPINQLQLLPAAEHRQILARGRGPEVEYPTDQCVHQLFEAQTEQTPEAEAVVFENQTLTYRELNQRANQLAHHLRSRDVGSDTLVGLCVDRSLEMCIGVLGTLKAGAAYVPLDPSLPPQRLSFLISNAECGVVITQDSMLELLTPCLAAIEPAPLLVLLETVTLTTRAADAANPVSLAKPHHLAYVLYTSGSTGHPKGVEMPHRPLVNLIHWQRGVSTMGPGDRTLQFASLGFDVSFQEMFATWATGGTLVAPPQELRIHPARLLAALDDWRINRMFLPFVMLEQLAEADRHRLAPPAHLKEVSVAGEQLRIGPAIRRFFERIPGSRLWNHYGPAEAHVVTSHELAGPPSAWPDLPVIGRPLPNCEILLLDERRQLVPPGVIGELYISGVCLARGYRQRPDLTSERFVPHPFLAEPGARQYRTGDLARWQGDGTLEFLGRADHQVKLRGFRVELGEIEAVLGRHPDVAACVVVAEEANTADKALAAYLVARKGLILAGDAIRTWLKESLPGYMIPARLVAVPALPLNANGKVERTALRQLAGTELAVGNTWQAPATEWERALVEIWQAVLRRDQTGVLDNFFELGGHSLLAASICAQITARFHVEVPLRWVFDHPTIRELAGKLNELAGTIVNTMSTPIKSADILTASERQQVLVEWNQTSRNYPWDQCLHELFEAQAARTPEAVAVRFEGQSITYGELNNRSNQLAGHLRTLGAGPEVLAGICMDRSLDTVVAMLGVLKSGSAYVPLATTLPDERLTFCLTDSQSQIVLTQRSVLDRIPKLEQTTLVLLDEDRENYSKANPPKSGHAGNLAYVMYTSGSTGTPKGVAIEHRSVTSFLHWVREIFNDEELAGVLASTSISFDLSVFEIFGPLSWGGQVILAQNVLVAADSPDWGRVRLVNTVPSLLAALLKTGTVPPASITVNLAGEALSTKLVNATFAAWPVRRINDLYGPTETTIYSTWSARQPDKPATIGRPIANTQVYVLDARREPVAAGEVGELYIAGVGMAREYLRRPKLTQEKFIANPFSRDSQARMYQTGDLARWHTDGTLEFLGRVDQQVKIRGFRIELGEIEAVLVQHAKVSVCVVLAQDCGPGEKELVAYLVLREHSTMPMAEIRHWAALKIPEYMVPARFIEVAALPLNANGKVDRKALARLEGMELGVGTEYVAPADERERELVQIWRAGLRRDQVGVLDNFFDLGGNSLVATSICAQISLRWQAEVPLRWIFEHPTIRGLAEKIVTVTLATNGGAITPANRDQPLEMSFGQQQMWLLQQSLTDPAVYNQPVACRLSGVVDREKVRQALQKIQHRHEVLRTALSQSDQRLVQCVVAAENAPLPWRELDLTRVPTDQKKATWEASLREEVRRPFDLSEAPLWRVVWITLAEDDQILVLTFHHSIIDEWSLRLLAQELERIYATEDPSAADALPALPVQYADYAVWQRNRLAGDLLARCRDYWRAELADLPPALELPANLIRPRHPTGRGAVYDFLLTGPVVKALRDLARQENTTQFTVALAAFHIWLYRHTGQTDVIVGTPSAHRNRPEVQALLGYFLNSLPIRARLSATRSFREVVGQVRPTLLNAIGHADLPFEQMVELAVQDVGAGQSPVYQVMFVLLEEGLPPLRLGHAESQWLGVGTGTSKQDLILSIQTTEHAWHCQFEYSTDLFTADHAARLGAHLTELLVAMATQPEAPISRLNLMTAPERQQILVEWNRTERDYPRDQCIHELFAEQVRHTPDAVAVELASETLTYQQLDRQATRLAEHLHAQGVGPGDIVGLRIERSLEMIITVLGILKAGAAYWAVEENMPEERFGLLCADARPKVLLVRRSAVERNRSLAGRTAEATVSVAAVEDWLEIQCPTAHATVAAPKASDPAYVCYTSGSTGRPKGVIVPHRGVVRLVRGADYVSLTRQETLLQHSPLSFDASTFEIWGALLNGGRLVLMPPGLPTLADLGDMIRHHEVTTVWLTAGLFHLMVDEKLAALQPLRQLLAGGEVLSPNHVYRARQALPGCRIINGYGPTENTTFTCCHTVGAECDGVDSIPIGRPIANTRVYVLDASQQPVPAGVAGELYAGGDGVACGYLNQPELTMAGFVPSPLGDRPGDRLYRTGDRVRWRTDGTLEFLGRTDQQVKIRGYRIELGEIEAMLGIQPEIASAVVVVYEPMPGDKRLTGYLVAKTKGKPDGKVLQARLMEKLPDYMVPSRFVWLDKLPLTPNGKIDRAALPVPATGGNAPFPQDSAPTTLLELELTRIWQRIFKREDIGRTDNFFALGGHSLQAVRMAAEIDKLLHHKIAITALFQSSTIEALARRLGNENWAPLWSSLVPLQPLGTKPPIFFVHGSKGEVFCFVKLAQELGADQPSYGINAVGLDGKTPRHERIEVMAAYYVREIVSIHGAGPINLCGYSMGGLLAYEVARQLHQAGRQVAVLALLDTSPLGPRPWFYEVCATAIHLFRRSKAHGRHLRTIGIRGQAKYLRQRWPAIKFFLLKAIGRTAATAFTPNATPQPLASQLPGKPGATMDYYHAVALDYEVQPYAGSMDLFVTEEEISIWRWYWRQKVQGRVSFHRIPGDHLNILEPEYLPALVKLLKKALAEAQLQPAATPAIDYNHHDHHRP